MRSRMLPALLVAMYLMACRGAEDSPVASSPGEPAAVPPAPGGPTLDPRTCEHYHRAFCEVTGGDLSPPCEAMGLLHMFLSPAACRVGIDQVAYTKAAYDAPRGACHELRDRVCRDLGAESDSCGLFHKRADNWEVERCALNLEQYAALITQLRENEAKHAPLSVQEQANVLVDPPATAGPAEAPVRIVAFSDFKCPFSAQAARSLAFVRKEFGEQVQVVFRNFPIDFHEHAHLAAQAALAAGAQGRFWEYHDLLFANPNALERTDLERYAQELGLNMARFRADLSGGRYKAQVDADIALGKSVKVEGTPTVFVNGRRLDRFREPAAVADAVSQALAR